MRVMLTSPLDLNPPSSNTDRSLHLAFGLIIIPTACKYLAHSLPDNRGVSLISICCIISRTCNLFSPRGAGLGLRRPGDVCDDRFVGVSLLEEAKG